jgi:hypothetical protein
MTLLGANRPGTKDSCPALGNAMKVDQQQQDLASGNRVEVAPVLLRQQADQELTSTVSWLLEYYSRDVYYSADGPSPGLDV